MLMHSLFSENAMKSASTKLMRMREPRKQQGLRLHLSARCGPRLAAPLCGHGHHHGLLLRGARHSLRLHLGDVRPGARGDGAQIPRRDAARRGARRRLEQAVVGPRHAADARIQAAAADAPRQLDRGDTAAARQGGGRRGGHAADHWRIHVLAGHPARPALRRQLLRLLQPDLPARARALRQQLAREPRGGERVRRRQPATCGTQASAAYKKKKKKKKEERKRRGRKRVSLGEYLPFQDVEASVIR